MLFALRGNFLNETFAPLSPLGSDCVHLAFLEAARRVGVAPVAGRGRQDHVEERELAFSEVGEVLEAMLLDAAASAAKRGGVIPYL
jgi:hypothetical protein